MKITIKKTWISIVLWVFLALLFTSVGCRNENDTENLLNRVTSIQYMTENYPPFNYEEDGQL